jgi:hypothetical protein
MKIAMTGASGFVGSSLTPFLSSQGHEVFPLVRREASAGEIFWDPSKGLIKAAKMEGMDAVIHLAGENIAAGRWSTARKKRIRDSRVEGTRLLSEALAGLRQPPRVLVCASAIGFYGDRGEEVLTEDSAPGSDFLAEVCRGWEAAAEPAREKGIRTVHLRFGVILSPKGGALKKMLFPFRLGAGGVIGSGSQFMSWIALDDVLGAASHALRTDSLSGPVNTVSPHPATNREFTRSLGKVLSRPTLFPMPAFAARLLFGEMADALLLSSSRVEPVRLKRSGYQFLYPKLDAALWHLLGR